MHVLCSKMVVAGPFKVGELVYIPGLGQVQINKIEGNKLQVITVEVDNNLNNVYNFELVEEFVTTMKLIKGEWHMYGIKQEEVMERIKQHIENETDILISMSEYMSLNEENRQVIKDYLAKKGNISNE